MTAVLRQRRSSQANAPKQPLIVSAPPTQDDPILSKVAMPFRAVFYPLGFAVEVASNEPAVLQAAAESWGALRQRRDTPLLRLRIGISDGGSGECPPAPVARGQRHLLSIVADSGNHAVCDLNAGFAFAWLNRSALLHPMYLRYHFIEAAALVLISAVHVIPIHAACVSLNGRGMLLCGDSGAGKSTLAYACACAGWTYITDDSSYLLKGAPAPTVIGNPRQIRFRPSAAALFPELLGRSPTPRAEGKPSVEVPTSELEQITATADEAQIQRVVFLNRQDSGAPELKPLSADVAYERFRRNLYPTDEIVRRQAPGLRRLSSVDACELRYSNLQQAVDLLERLAFGEQAASR